MASKVTPSMPGAPSFSSASSYASRSVSILQTWTYSPQKRQDVSAFALTYSLRLRSCKLMDAFVISSLPSRLKETLQSSRALSLRGRYPASSLLRTQPPPSRLRPTSRFRRLYGHWDRNRARPAVGEGFPFLLFRLQDGFTVPPWLTFPEAPLSVGSRTGAPAGLSTVPRFLSPPRRTQHADFPHCALPLASRQGLWDLSGRCRFRSVVSHSIAVEQPESVVQPRPIPPLPAEAFSFPSLRQLAPDLLLHPIFDVAEALTGVSN